MHGPGCGVGIRQCTVELQCLGPGKKFLDVVYECQRIVQTRDRFETVAIGADTAYRFNS